MTCKDNRFLGRTLGIQPAKGFECHAWSKLQARARLDGQHGTIHDPKVGVDVVGAVGSQGAVLGDESADFGRVVDDNDKRFFKCRFAAGTHDLQFDVAPVGKVVGDFQLRRVQRNTPAVSIEVHTEVHFACEELHGGGVFQLIAHLQMERDGGGFAEGGTDDGIEADGLACVNFLVAAIVGIVIIFTQLLALIPHDAHDLQLCGAFLHSVCLGNVVGVDEIAPEYFLRIVLLHHQEGGDGTGDEW